MRRLIVDRSGPRAWPEVRAALRAAAMEGWDPRDVGCDDGAQGALFEGAARPRTPAPTPRFPTKWRQVFRRVAHHRQDDSVALLYRLLHRYQSDPGLPERAIDADVRELALRDAAVRRDAHKAKAFVRFREVEEGAFAAWHCTDHFVLPLVAGFFVRRFSDMRWSIVTPDVSLHAEPGGEPRWGPGAPRASVPDGDALDALWRTYYRATFNPARLNLEAMRAEMPKKHWRTMPETRDLKALIAEAPARVAAMAERARPTVADVMPTDRRLPSLRRAASACVACPLYGPATQTVFGEGPPDAPLVVVGEQPGDQEDRRGRPFVGPAGTLLRELMEGAGLPPAEAYLTNAVKHFRFRGKRRLHDRPRAGEVQACRPWLLAELSQLKPRVLLLLGATATRSLLGQRVRFRDLRGRLIESPFAPATIATWHPSAILRAPDPDAIQRELTAALALARHALGPESTARARSSVQGPSLGKT